MAIDEHDEATKATLGLIGSIANNIQNYTDDFYHNRPNCPFAENIMERCDNDNNPTVFCDPAHCPLGR